MALKLIKAGMDTKVVVARFGSERQALALMDDPNIARVFDAGSTAEGRLYFVMEHVAGLPITEYCDRRRLTMRERLDVRRQVLGPDHPETLKSMLHLALTLGDEGGNAGAEKMERELLDIERRVLGPEHPDTLGTINNLAVSPMHEGRYAESERMKRELLTFNVVCSGPSIRRRFFLCTIWVAWRRARGAEMRRSRSYARLLTTERLSTPTFASIRTPT